MSNCHSWPLDATNGGLDLPLHLPLHLPIWALTVEMSNCHSWPLDATNGGLDVPVDLPLHLPIWALTGRNVKWPFLTTRWHYWGAGVDLSLHLPIWSLTVEMWNCHSWPLDSHYHGGVRSASRSATSSANMISNSRNVKLPFLTTRWHYHGGLDLPVDLPLHLPIWTLTVEMWNHHSWPVDGTTGELDLPVDLPLHLPIWSLTVEMWNCHSWPWPLDAHYWGVRSASRSATSSDNMIL